MSQIEDYLSSLPEPQKHALSRVRAIVIQTVPTAKETFSYGMPAFKYNGKPLFYYAAFKNHLSVFPTSKPTMILKDKLAGYNVTKGTVQFTIEKPLPEATIIKMLQIRLADIDGVV